MSKWINARAMRGLICFPPARLGITWSLTRSMADDTSILKCNTSPLGLSMHLSHHLGESTRLIEVHHFQSPTSDTSHYKAGAINFLRFLANLSGTASRQSSHLEWEVTIFAMLVSCTLQPPTANKNPRASSGGFWVTVPFRACWASNSWFWRPLPYRLQL